MLILAEYSLHFYDPDNWSIKFYNEQHQLHRNDGPAVIFSYGRECWYQDGKAHREDGPAEYSMNDEYYYIDDNLLTKEEFENWRIMKALQDSIKKELKS